MKDTGVNMVNCPESYTENLRFVYILFIALLFVFYYPNISPAEESCTQLLTTRCEICHYLTRVCQKVDAETSKKYWFGGPKGTWKRILKNMVKQGAVLNDAEETFLVECLSKPSPGVVEFCKLKK